MIEDQISDNAAKTGAGAVPDAIRHQSKGNNSSSKGEIDPN